MTDLRAKLEELQKLCDEDPFPVFDMAKLNQFIAASRQYMPLLIEVARATEKLRTKSNTRYALGRVPEYFDVLKAIAAIKEADAK